MRIKSQTALAVVILAVSFAIAQNAAPRQPNPASETVASQAAISETEDVAIGEPVEWASPKYPKEALKARLQGTVMLVLSIDKEGYVSNASVVRGDPQLAEAALRSSRRWKYVPYYVNGRPAAVMTKVVFVFSISQSGRPDVAVAFKYPPKVYVGPVFKKGDGVTAPKPIYSPEPPYSKKAKEDKYQGLCVLSIVVGPDGKTYEVKVTRSLGEGLDEKAIETVRTWRFEPALKDGKPVAATIKIEIEFRLD